VDGVVPLFPFSEFPVPGQFVGTCIVDQLISPQVEINLSLSQIADYRNRRIMPTLVEFTGNPKQDEALSNAPGKKYKALSPDMRPDVHRESRYRSRLLQHGRTQPPLDAESWRPHVHRPR
jgi:hypothetical protein